MSYNITYKLTLKDLTTELDKKYIKFVKKDVLKTFNFLDTDLESCEYSWRNYEEELVEFSTKYTNVLFILTGVGENIYFNDIDLEADIWIAYFLSGTTYTDYLEYKFPKFNNTKLNIYGH